MDPSYISIPQFMYPPHHQTRKLNVFLRCYYLFAFVDEQKSWTNYKFAPILISVTFFISPCFNCLQNGIGRNKCGLNICSSLKSMNVGVASTHVHFLIPRYHKASITSWTHSCTPFGILKRLAPTICSIYFFFHLKMVPLGDFEANKLKYFNRELFD